MNKVIVLLICIGFSLPLFGKTVPFSKTGHTLFIAHPTLSDNGEYLCVLEIPIGDSINKEIGPVLVLKNRKGEWLGRATLIMPIVEGKYFIEFSLSKHLIKNSYVLYQINPNTDKMAFVKVFLGEHKTTRKVNGVIKHEVID